MTKAALAQLTRNLAVEWSGDAIRVNAVAPWYTKTPLVESLLKDEGYLQDVLSRTPLGRIAEAEEVAAAVVFYVCLLLHTLQDNASQWTADLPLTAFRGLVI